MTQQPLLEIKNVTVIFEGYKALDNISLAVLPNTLQVILGPNGAGKSTLMDTIIGRVRPISGKIIFKGEDITTLSEYEIANNGICRKFQTPSILPTLTVEDNILLAGKKNRHWWHAFDKSIDESDKKRADEILARINLTEERYRLAKTLAHGAKQRLEMGMVISSGSDLLLLDEPAAGLTESERTKMAEMIKNLVQNHTAIVIDHDMHFIEQLAANICVLHTGRLLKQGNIAEIRQDPEVRSIYLGRDESE